MTHPRRVFLMAIAASSAALTTLSTSVHAQAKVDEKDPQAAALGYAADTTKVDAKKYPNHAAAQACGNCALYQGKPADAAGACPLFAGKVVAAKGWCSAWAKKG
ncbi:high-potential iron-sulfur protein [Rhodoferax sp. WC2427]|uniref:high-potential iron-sulfur protein n=1 Tax=Rhodoferax sp. WC2427 TaxID=3234144 RepID=UPI00346685B6